MTSAAQDRRWMAGAAALGARARPLSRPNPAVGAIIVREGMVVGRGWTGSGGRPHAEAVALAQAGDQAVGATLYVSLEPCAHQSARGPACADLVAASGLARVVVGCGDPDPRTAGAGMARLRDAGITVDLLESAEGADSLSGYLSRHCRNRPEVILKLALSLDGRIALPDGQSQWITGEVARAHGHALRARCDAILVGGGTVRADAPRLDVRLPGLEARSPQRWVLTRSSPPDGWRAIATPDAVHAMPDCQYLLVEGGAGAAAAFLSRDLVDRLFIYRAPIILGAGPAGVGDIGLASLGNAHGRWQLADRRSLGIDTLEVYSRVSCLPA